MMDYLFLFAAFLLCTFVHVSIAGYLTVLMGEYLMKRIKKLEANISKTIS